MITSACVIFFTKDDKKYEIPCHRHADAFYIISQFIPSSQIERDKTLQGFYNDKDEFLTRHEAYEEAQRCNQIKVVDAYKELFSEYLW